MSNNNNGNLNRTANSAPSPSQNNGNAFLSYQNNNLNQRPLSSTGSHNNIQSTNKGPIIMKNLEKSQVWVENFRNQLKDIIFKNFFI
jgi:hypothetical protein